MVALPQDSKTRGRIALLVISVWLGLLVLSVFATILGLLQTEDLKEIISMWHQILTPIASLVVGFYFGSPNKSGDSRATR